MVRRAWLAALSAAGLATACLSLGGADDDPEPSDGGADAAIWNDSGWPDASGSGGTAGSGGGGAATGGLGGGGGGSAASGGTGDGGVTCTTSPDCDDFNACTKDVCANGQCVITPIPITDNDACTTDSCNPATGISHVPIDCSDKNDCTLDTCLPASGCKHSSLPGTTVCGTSCPAGSYVSGQTCSSSCSGDCFGKGYNQVTCSAVCGNSFTTCSNICPAGYAATKVTCPASCVLSGCAAYKCSKT